MRRQNYRGPALSSVRRREFESVHLRATSHLRKYLLREKRPAKRWRSETAQCSQNACCRRSSLLFVLCAASTRDVKKEHHRRLHLPTVPERAGRESAGRPLRSAARCGHSAAAWKAQTEVLAALPVEAPSVAVSLHLPDPGCLRSLWNGVGRSLGWGDRDGHPLVAMPLTEPSLPPPPSCSPWHSMATSARPT